LFVSSSQVYGNLDSAKENFVDENFNIAPINHYGASKASGEHLTVAFCRESGMPYIIARPFNHTGIGQSADFIIPKLVRSFKNRDEEIKLGNIDTIREFIDVRDIAHAYRLMIEKSHQFDGDVFNVASGVGYKIRDVIKIIEDISGHKIRVSLDETLLRSVEIYSIIGNASKFKAMSGWNVRYSLRDTISWMLNSGSNC